MPVHFDPVFAAVSQVPPAIFAKVTFRLSLWGSGGAFHIGGERYPLIHLDLQPLPTCATRQIVPLRSLQTLVFMGFLRGSPPKSKFSRSMVSGEVQFVSVFSFADYLRANCLQFKLRNICFQADFELFWLSGSFYS